MLGELSLLGDNLGRHIGATVSFWLLGFKKEVAESRMPCWSSGHMEAMKTERMKTMAAEDEETTRGKSLGKGLCVL